MRRLIIFLILIAFSVPAYSATIYKWVDKEGVVNFTDDPDKVPPSYRDRVEVESRKDVQGEKIPLSPPAITSSGKGDETTTDTYGRDETWWRDKVRQLREKLKEATERYDAAQKKYTEKSDELSRRKFGSPTQYKMNIIELDRLKEERDKQESQVSEAKAALEKLSREAKEAKADPSWLD